MEVTRAATIVMMETCRGRKLKCFMTTLPTMMPTKCAKIGGMPVKDGYTMCMEKNCSSPETEPEEQLKHYSSSFWHYFDTVYFFRSFPKFLLQIDYDFSLQLCAMFLSPTN